MEILYCVSAATAIDDDIDHAIAEPNTKLPIVIKMDFVMYMIIKKLLRFNKMKNV